MRRELVTIATWGALCLAAIACGASSHPPPAGENPYDGGADTGATGLDAGDADALVTDGADADAADVPAISPLTVLFIGNSYTSVNDLPGTLRALSVAAHDAPPIEVSSITPGATTLQNHWDDPAVQTAIAGGAHTHVVLQGQSVEPLGWPSNFEQYAQLLGDLVHGAGSAAVFYETWARPAGDAIYTEAWSGGSPDAMQDGLLAEYRKVATAADAKLAPVGEAFREVRLHHPSIALTVTDGHPTTAGTYLAACVFYDVLTGRTFTATGGSGAIPTVDAAILRQVAAQVVAANP